MNTKTRKDLLADDEFNSESVKVRITTMIDLDALKLLKQLAKKRKTKYQTLLNSIVRSYLFGPELVKNFEVEVRRIVKEELAKKA